MKLFLYAFDMIRSRFACSADFYVTEVKTWVGLFIFVSVCTQLMSISFGYVHYYSELSINSFFTQFTICTSVMLRSITITKPCPGKSHMSPWDDLHAIVHLPTNEL